VLVVMPHCRGIVVAAFVIHKLTSWHGCWR
jgi:hypothetical protein